MSAFEKYAMTGIHWDPAVKPEELPQCFRLVEDETKKRDELIEAMVSHDPMVIDGRTYDNFNNVAA